MSFAKRLKKLREAKGFNSQKDLAKAVGVSRQAVGMWEIGEREPDYATLQKLAHVLGTSMSYLLGETDDPRPPAKASAAAPNREAGVKDGDPIPPDLQLNIERAMLRVLKKWEQEGRPKDEPEG